MSKYNIPERASLEYLRKLAKERLRLMRESQAGAQLTEAQLAIARELGAPSWRVLKAEIERRQSPELHAFFTACGVGDIEAMRALLQQNPAVANDRMRGGSTPLHRAVQFPDAVQLLLDFGANPNARDTGDNALPLHFAAGGAPLSSVRALLDSGSDVHGHGDEHRLDVIGWATVFDEARRDVVELLLERGAQHHVFSAIAAGDHDALQRLVENNTVAIARRLAHSEGGQSALHYVIAPPDGLVGGRFRTGEHYDTLALLLELGADVEARDDRSRTPLELAMLRSDERAMHLLRGAGAQLPSRVAQTAQAPTAGVAPSIEKIVPMLAVPDIDATLAWYASIGFQLTGKHEEHGQIGWASMALGEADVMFVPFSGALQDTSGVSLWIRTLQLDAIYEWLKQRQMERAAALFDGTPTSVPDVKFKQDLYSAFYGQREFCIVDLNGMEINFFQPLVSG